MRGGASLGLLAECLHGLGDGGVVERARVERVFNAVGPEDETVVSAAEAMANLSRGPSAHTLECPAWLTPADGAHLRAYRAAAAAEGFDPTRSQDLARARATPWARFDNDATIGEGMLRVEAIVAVFAVEALLEREYNRAPSRSALLALLRRDRCAKWLFHHAAPGLCEALEDDADEPLTLAMFRKVLQNFSTEPRRFEPAAAPAPAVNAAASAEPAPDAADVLPTASLEIPPHAVAAALRAEARAADVTERDRTRVHVDRNGEITIGRSASAMTAAPVAALPPPPPPPPPPRTPPPRPRSPPHTPPPARQTQPELPATRVRVNRHGSVEIAAASIAALPPPGDVAGALADPPPPPPLPPADDQLVLLRGDDGASVVGTAGDVAVKIAAAGAPHYENPGPFGMTWLTPADVCMREVVDDVEVGVATATLPPQDAATARVHVDRDGIVEVTLPYAPVDPPPHARGPPRAAGALPATDAAHADSLSLQSVARPTPAIKAAPSAPRRSKRYQPYGVHIDRNGAIEIAPQPPSALPLPRTMSTPATLPPASVQQPPYMPPGWRAVNGGFANTATGETTVGSDEYIA